ncbi:uncharacterized protein [Musca autumnalis]|uniref:uncharacterized protein n=1 Tax=Musca autumnalis TaxID=221902 RepID=UPI003CEEF348
MGNQGLGEINENGEMFTEMCSSNNMIIGGTLFPHKRSHKITWVSPDGRTENQIDHICINKMWRHSLLDTRNKRSADIGSDHHLLIGEFRLKIVRTDTRNINTSTRLDIQKLKNPNIRQQYRQQLQLNITNIAPHGNVDSKWNAIKDAFVDAGSKVLGHQRKTKKDWICTTTWEVIDERRRKKAAVNSARTRASKEAANRQYETLNKSVKRMCRLG